MECDDLKAIGALNLLWRWGLKNANGETGLCMDADKDDIANIFVSHTETDPMLIVDALLKSGWLDKRGDDYYIHDWPEHQRYWRIAQERRKKDAMRKKDGCKNTESVGNGNYYEYELDREGYEHKTDESQGEDHQSGKNSRYTVSFEEIWAIYPRHIGKASAYAKYNARLNEGWSPEQLKEATAAYAAQVRKNGTEEKYIKHAQTFFGPNTPFVDFLKNKGSFKEETPDDQKIMNPFAEYVS